MRHAAGCPRDAFLTADRYSFTTGFYICGPKYVLYKTNTGLLEWNLEYEMNKTKKKNQMER